MHRFLPGFFSSLAWDGCRDYSSALSLPRTVDLWKSIGIDKVKSYTNDLNLNALEVLREAWGNNGGGRTLAPIELHGPMTLVALPTTSSFSSTLPFNTTWTDADAKAIQDTLHHDYRIECPVKCIDGELYARISVHVYNEIKDYHVLASAVQKVMKREV